MVATVPLGMCPPRGPRAWQGMAAAPKPLCLLCSGMGRGQIPKLHFGAAWFVHLGKEGMSGGSMPCRCLPKQGTLLRMSLAALPCPWGAGWEEAAEGA